MILPESIQTYDFQWLSFEQDQAIVHTFLKRNETYLIWQDNKPVDRTTTHDFFYGDLPEGYTLEDRLSIGVFENQTLIALFDILKNYPIASTWVIGLMLLEGSLRGKGLGTTLYSQIEKYLAHCQVKTVRLGVLIDHLSGKAYWQKMGFHDTGQVKIREDGRKVLVYEKPILINPHLLA